MEGIEQEIEQESGQNTDRYYAVIDTETTGLGIKTAQILQFGIVIFTSNGSEIYKIVYTNRFNFGYNVPLTPYVRDNIKLQE
jgi:DNA polymerase III epsilon subunit-like protein